MVPVAFSTLSCPDWSWHEMIEQGRRHGYDGVEIRLIERQTDLLQIPELQPGKLVDRRRELAKAGFRVCGLASSVRFDEPEPEQQKQQHRIGRAYIDLAAELEASFVRVFGDTLPANPETPATDGDGMFAPSDRQRGVMRQVAEGLDQLGEYAAGFGIDVLIETHGDFIDSRIMRETMRMVGSPAVGVLWDTHHPWRFLGEQPADTVARLRPWIRHTHWKDSVLRPQRRAGNADDADVAMAAQQATVLMAGHRHADYVLFGGGEFPADECLHLLRGIDYSGWYSLEWEKMWHPEIEDAEIVVPLFPGKIRRMWRSVAAECD